jgi:RNA polymerase sigma-70 factor (ECF subfamily)
VSEPTDEELMMRIAANDQQAFAMLVRRHLDALYNYALRLTSRAAYAEDLVQETWLAAWQHAKGFNPRKAKVTTWLHRILHNKFIDTARKSRLQFDEATVTTAVDDYDAERTAAQNQQSALLDALITALPERQRAAIVLSYAQGFANRDVAQILGIGIRATESLLARAKQTLHASYNQNTNIAQDVHDVNGTKNHE